MFSWLYQCQSRKIFPGYSTVRLNCGTKLFRVKNTSYQVRRTLWDDPTFDRVRGLFHNLFEWLSFLLTNQCDGSVKTKNKLQSMILKYDSKVDLKFRFCGEFIHIARLLLLKCYIHKGRSIILYDFPIHHVRIRADPSNHLSICINSRRKCVHLGWVQELLFMQLTDTKNGPPLKLG